MRASAPRAPRAGTVGVGAAGAAAGRGRRCGGAVVDADSSLQNVLAAARRNTNSTELPIRTRARRRARDMNFRGRHERSDSDTDSDRETEACQHTGRSGEQTNRRTNERTNERRIVWVHACRRGYMHAARTRARTHRFLQSRGALGRKRAPEHVVGDIKISTRFTDHR